MMVRSRKLTNLDMIAWEDTRDLSAAMVKRFVWE